MNPHKRNLIIAISIFVVAAIALTFYLIKIYIPELQSSPSELVKCNTLEFSDENAINLLYFGEEYKAQEYHEFLMNSEPYNKFQNHFNAYYIDEYFPECELYQGVATLCQSKELLKKAASCPNDYITVLVPGLSSSIRSSAYLGVASINLAHPKSVLLHELGHTISNLADEYVPSKLPRGQENCGSSCTKFTGFEGCFIECSDTSHVRQFENGIMRTLSTNDYGDYDNYLISESIKDQSKEIAPITGSQIAEDGECYVVTIINGVAAKQKMPDNSYCAEPKAYDPTILFTDVEIDGELSGGALDVTGEFEEVYLMELPSDEDVIVTSFNTEGERILVSIPSEPEESLESEDQTFTVTRALREAAEVLLPSETIYDESKTTFTEVITQNPSILQDFKDDPTMDISSTESELTSDKYTRITDPDYSIFSSTGYTISTTLRDGKISFLTTILFLATTFISYFFVSRRRT